ncbi:monooxygenase [Actinoplanes sp. TBRC 11911]|uniref:FAD-dependent monooxygenase n=1 Tax=Actinoplanes sp. TBRC 11911 TaxID=2729386 RepID=UPI00145E68C2|nr:FAD-dependent monooxygenase [Actinoplanes sp. TBRC 11911]NMO57001.1 monooxygenase [Actinoplanes sp. TBRC 11911]
MSRVVIVGAGPTGLWLGSELALAGVDVTLIEQRTERNPAARAFTNHPRTLELWASRGIVDRFLEAGHTVPHSHFGLLDDRLDFHDLDTRFPHVLILEQPRIEEILEEYALGLGVDIRFGHAFTGLTQRPDSVVVSVSGPGGEYELEGDYLVGCDGSRSPVRAAAGIGASGTESTGVSWIAEAVLDDPPEVNYYSAHSPAGNLLIVDVGNGRHRIGGFDARPGDQDDSAVEFTLAEMAEKATAVAGTDFGLRETFWRSRDISATRLADTYRAGRVLLAGDSAHRIFPAGGRGLNTGMHDAHNLGWKLAATMNGWAPDDLLDSYHEERHPVGAAVMRFTRAQMPLMTQFTPQIAALREVLSEMIARVPELNRILSENTSGLDVVYPPKAPDAHPLTGRRAPDLTFGDGTSLLGLVSTPARYLLLDLASHPLDVDEAAPVVVHSGTAEGDRPDWRNVTAALIRPDGHVAWATEETGEARQAAAEAALKTIRR